MKPAYVLLLIGALFGHAQTSQANGGRPLTLTIRAPIDGYVTLHPDIGSEYEAGSSAGTWSASLSQGACSSETVGMNLREQEFFREATKLSGATVLKISSPILDRQIASARFNVSSHESNVSRITVANRREAEKNELQAIYEHSKREFESFYVNQKYHLAWHTPDNADQMTRETAAAFLRYFDVLRNNEMAFLRTNQDIFLNFTMVNILEDANRRLSSARCNLDILLATSLLGDIYCPARCVVTDLQAIKGQWVNKGDALFSVEILD